MLDQIINNFIFSRLLYIVIVTLIGFAVISDLKKKDKIEIKEYLNINKIDITLLLKYLFLSFIVRILLEQLVIFLNIPSTDIQVPLNIFEIITQFVVSCIFAPIFEEIIFRFGLYKKLNKKLNIYISILITSLVFSLIHFYNIDGIIILLEISLIWHYNFVRNKFDMALFIL